MAFFEGEILLWTLEPDNNAEWLQDAHSPLLFRSSVLPSKVQKLDANGRRLRERDATIFDYETSVDATRPADEITLAAAKQKPSVPIRSDFDMRRKH